MISTKNVNVQHTKAYSQIVEETELDGNMWFMVSHVHCVVDAKCITRIHNHNERATKRAIMKEENRPNIQHDTGNYVAR